MRPYEKTSNGIEYTDEIAGPDGAGFVLYPTAEHTPEMIKSAVRVDKTHQNDPFWPTQKGPLRQLKVTTFAKAK